MTGTIHQLKIENQGKLGSKLMDVINKNFKKKTSNSTKSVDIFWASIPILPRHKNE